MVRTLVIAGLVLGLAACVDVATTVGADGRATHTIDCDVESDGCFAKAAELCPGGYYLMDRKAGTTEVPHTAGLIAAPHTRLIIECK